ncbi:MAG: dTDP-4-dehydrorhamnose reductase [Verrucomicrobiota bacterium]
MQQERSIESVAVTGTTGRLGDQLARWWSRQPGVVVHPLPRKSLDLADPLAIRQKLETLDFDLLINPAAMTDLENCERQPELAGAINAIAPGVLAECCRDRGASFVHVSTDYVFDGKEPGQRREEETPSPINHYGRTKRDGELNAFEANPDATVVRTSWLFGSEKPSFVETILTRATDQEEIVAISNKESCPTFCPDFCEALDHLLRHSPEGQLVQISNAGPCSWFDYARAIFETGKELGFPLKARSLRPIKLEDLDVLTAERPIHTAMATDKLTDLSGHVMRPWKEALTEYLHWLKPRWEG